VPAEEGDLLTRKALEHLRKAFEYGWRDLKIYLDDPDLEPLRKRPEFDALHREWRAALESEK
jgi:hypothetical protein